MPNFWEAKLQPSANMQSNLLHTLTLAAPSPTPTFLQRDTLDRDTVSEAAAVATPGFLLLRSPLPRAIAWPYLIVSLSRCGMSTTLGRKGAFQRWGGRQWRPEMGWRREWQPQGKRGTPSPIEVIREGPGKERDWRWAGTTRSNPCLREHPKAGSVGWWGPCLGIQRGCAIAEAF